MSVTEVQANHPESYTILGAWDTDPDKGVLSYLSPLAQALMNKKVGEEVEFEMDGHRKRYRVDSIEACAPEAPAAPLTPATPPTPASPIAPTETPMPEGAAQ